MTDFIYYILTALALVCVFEGLMYALFPQAVRKMMILAITMNDQKFRQLGLSIVILGFMTLWLIYMLKT